MKKRETYDPARQHALAELMLVIAEYEDAKRQLKKARETLVAHIRTCKITGLSQQEIADVLHMSRQRVAQFLEE